MVKLSKPQRKALEALADGGYLQYGMYGGITGQVYGRSGAFLFHLHSNTVKALLAREYIHKEQRRLVITNKGRAALTTEAADANLA